MTVNSVGALKNEDGSYVKISNDGNDIVEEYEEIYQEEMDKILSRFTDEELTTLNDAYFESYCTEADNTARRHSRRRQWYAQGIPQDPPCRIPLRLSQGN